MLKIKDFELNTNIILAPLAGISDLPYRLIMREFGAKFAFFEMIDDNSIIRKSRESYDKLLTTEKDAPIGAQILSATPESAVKGAEKILKLRKKVKLIDLNAACPVRKVIKKKAGAYLLTDIKALTGILKTLVKELPLPVTVKLRTGFNKNDTADIAVIAKKCEDSGVSAIFIHGRTRNQNYSGKIDFTSIKKVKEAVSVPVIGSGNIFSEKEGRDMLEKTGCNGLLVARGSFGNPWIFRELEAMVKGKNHIFIPSKEDKIKVLKRHLTYINLYSKKDLRSKIGIMRRISQYYIHQFPGARKIRGLLTSAKSYEEIKGIIDAISA